MKTGYDAIGMKVPANRRQKGYLTIKEILDCDSSTADSIVGKMCNYIENDQTSYIIGNINGLTIFGKQDKLDTIFKNIDITGRYRILAELLTD